MYALSSFITPSDYIFCIVMFFFFGCGPPKVNLDRCLRFIVHKKLKFLLRLFFHEKVVIDLDF